MKNSISKKQFNRKKMYIISAMLITMLVLPVNVLATSDAVGGLKNLATIFSTIVSIIGGLFGIYSFTILGPGLAQHDNSQIKMGLMQLAGALITVFHMQILNLIGITI